jgi:hypothetical protein
MLTAGRSVEGLLKPRSTAGSNMLVMQTNPFMIVNFRGSPPDPQWKDYES